MRAEPDSGLSRHATKALKPAWRHAGFLLAVLLAPVLVPAQPVTSTGDYLSRMDSDGDGRVSLTEYQDWLSYAFDAMDRNGDGQLDPSEQPPRARGNSMALTREAHRQTLAERFRKQDRNRDGFLDARELASPPQ